MQNLSEKIGQKLKEKNHILITAESCTAGLIASTIAETSGSSSWLEGGFIVYTPEMKTRLLQVHPITILEQNITSEAVAYEMALGALENSINATLSIAVTGVAGPNGGTEEIPVGTVCIAWGRLYGETHQVITEKCFFTGNRNEIRQKVVEYSLNKMLQLLS